MRVQDSAKPRAKPLVRLGSFALRRASHLSGILYCAGVLGLLLLPLAAKDIYHDENALLVGHAESRIRCLHRPA